MKKKILSAVFLFSFIFNVVFIIHMFTVKHSVQNGAENDLILSDLQKRTIEEESAGIINENIALEAELKKYRQDLYNLLDSEVTDRTEIEKCITSINKIQKKIQLNTVEQILIHKKHMTKDQCKCFLKEFGDKMNVHHQCSENCSCND